MIFLLSFVKSKVDSGLAIINIRVKKTWKKLILFDIMSI